MRIATSLYIPRSTPVHACNALVKIAGLLAFTIAVFFVDTWWGMGLAVLAVCALAALARIPFRRMALPLVPIAVLALFALVCNVFYATDLQTGLSLGAFVALRMVLLVAASFIVCFTTTSDDLVNAFCRVLAPLRHVRVPVDDVSLVLSMALRFIPVIAEEFASVHDAQASRGARFATGSLFVRLRAWGAVFVPVFVGLFRRADKVAVAMDARCYGAAAYGEGAAGRTSLHPFAFRIKDAAALAGVLAGCVVLALL